MMVGRILSLWEGDFSGFMLNFFFFLGGGVIYQPFMFRFHVGFRGVYFGDIEANLETTPFSKNQHDGVSQLGLRKSNHQTHSFQHVCLNSWISTRLETSVLWLGGEHIIQIIHGPVGGWTVKMGSSSPKWRGENREILKVSPPSGHTWKDCLQNNQALSRGVQVRNLPHYSNWLLKISDGWSVLQVTFRP